MTRLLRDRRAQWVLWTLVAGIYLVPLFTVKGAFDMFIKIDSIDGESVDDKHHHWIDVQSFQWGIDRPIEGAGSNRTTRAAEHQDLTFTKWIDKSSPKLMLHVCDGTHIPEATVEIRMDSKQGQEPYITYKLTDCIVTGVRPRGQSSDPGPPTEGVSLNYTKIEWTYSTIDLATGATTYQDSAVCDVESQGGTP